MAELKPRVLVLCTGNSCRSQMAEAYLREFGRGRIEVASAGTRPAASIHPLTLRVMAEDGLDLSDHRPKDYRSFVNEERIDYLITVCNGAARACPTGWPGVAKRLRWPFDDPAALAGSEAEVFAGFRRVRDEIKHRSRQWLESFEKSSVAVPARVS